MKRKKTVGDWLRAKEPKPLTKKQQLAALRKAIKAELVKNGIQFDSRSRTVVDNGKLDEALRKTLQGAGFKIQYSLFND